MRLISCYIENFGKLRDLEIVFDAGQSVIYEENGWGKSTLAAVIKVMFYGFDHEGKHDETVNERKRFRPWQKGVFGGRLVFESGGKEYRLERTFDEKRSGADTFELFDHETNRPYSIPEDQVPGGNIGGALFGVDSRSFQRTVLIRQGDCAETDATAEISARIGRVSDQTADMGNYETVRTSLERELNRLAPGRKTGQISKLREEITNLSGIVREREGLQKALEQIEHNTSQLKMMRHEEQEEQKKISSEIRMIANRQKTKILEEQYRSLKKAEADAKDRVTRERSTFSAHPPSLSEIDEQIKNTRNCIKNRVTIQSPREQAELLRLMAASGNKEEESEEKSFSGLFLPAGVLLLVTGAFLALIGHLAPGLLLSAAGIGASVLWWYLNHRDIRLPSGTSVEVDGYQAAKVRYARLMKGIERDEKETAEMEQKARSFLFHYTGSSSPSGFDELETALQDMKRRTISFYSVWEEYQKRKAERESFEETHDSLMLQDRLNDEPPGTEDTDESSLLRDRAEILERKQSEIEEISAKIHDQERQAEEIDRRLEEIGQAEADLDEKTKEMTALQHRYDVIRKTKDYLEEAKTRFSARYMGTVRTSFERYYRMIAGNDGMLFEMDADYNVKIRDKGGLHDPGFLSEGSRDLVGLCRRMAMIDAMYEKEKPFLIFDDPFISLDDRRLAGALRFLDLISEDYQVIYLSCSEARIPAE